MSHSLPRIPSGTSTRILPHTDNEALGTLRSSSRCSALQTLCRRFG